MAKITYTDKEDNTTSSLPAIKKARAADFNEIKTSVNVLYDFVESNGQELIIQTEDDLPAVVNGYHQIPANTVLNFKALSIDLVDGLEFLGNAMIKGSSSETTFLNGTIENQSFIKTAFSLPIQNISITVNGDGASIFEIDGDGVNNAHDWYFMNTFGNADIGTITNTSNFVVFGCAFFNSGAGFSYDGTIGTISFNQCLFSGMTKSIELTATAVVTRRFRVIYSSIVALNGNTGIIVSASATIPVNAYILDTVNFSGSGTYISGIDFTSNKALFTNNIGIINSREISQYGMTGNAIATVVAESGVAYKVLGNTVSGVLTSKFVNTNNRATYIGTIEKVFAISATLSVQSGNNHQIGIYVAKNGALLSESEIYITTNAAGRAESAAVQAIAVLGTDDYIEIFVENDTQATNITVTELNVIVK